MLWCYEYGRNLEIVETHPFVLQYIRTLEYRYEKTHLYPFYHAANGRL